MSTSTIIALLSISEFALLASAIAAFLFIRSRRHKNLYDLKPHTPVKTADAPHAEFPDFLEKYMLNTERRMQACGPEEVHLLSKRLEFLQSELQAFKDTDDDDVYWHGIHDRMSKLVAPKQLEQTASEDDTLNELDDIDSPIDKQSDIPVLDEQVSPETPPSRGGVTVDTSKDELRRLRNIISRQHNSMDELKETLFNNNNHNDAEGGKLAEQLEEIEVAHAQLNMCVEVLEQENKRLNEVIGSMAFGDESVNIDATITDLSGTKQELEKAQERITDLVVENGELGENVQNLEAEIISLEERLRTRSAELEQIRSQESDLSTDKHDGDIKNPEDLRKEIEDISQSLATKSEQLSILQQQMESQSDLEFDQIDIGTKDDNGDSDDDRPVLDDVDLDEIMQQFDESTLDDSPGNLNDDHKQPTDLVESSSNEMLDISEDTQQKTG